MKETELAQFFVNYLSCYDLFFEVDYHRCVDIVGFGKTIHEAVDDFTAQFDKLVKSEATNEHCLGDTSRMG